MKINILKNTIKFMALLSCSIVLSAGFAMETPEVKEEDERIRSYFKEDAAVIQGALGSVAQAELHFFWTTGRELDALKADYEANFQVNIGGASYGDKFPLYIEFLLENSPAHLKVKFVCDEMTRASNTRWIPNLQEKYGQRFQILDIHGVVKNVIQALPDQKDLLLTLFQNATKGNPAIASDPYRLIGLVYGSNPTPENVKDTQYTYCDVDTFCFGMSQPNQTWGIIGFDFTNKKLEMGFKEENGHTNLVKALFCPMQMQRAPIKQPLFVQPRLTVDTPVYIGRNDSDGRRGNNLIKLRIRNLKDYNSFCRDVLSKMFSSRELKMDSPDELNLLNYFPTLHDHVSKGVEDSEAEFARYLEKFSSSAIDTNDIISVTGPVLLNRLEFVCFPLGQEYPDTTAMEWHRTHYLEQGHKGPLYDIDSKAFSLKDSVLGQFTQYARKLSNAFYTFRFGSNHPFNIKMKDHLITHFPYASSNFKSYMEQFYNDPIASSEKDSNVSVDDWLNEKFEKLTGGLKILKSTEDIILIDSSYYVRLHHVLKQLGIDRPLMRDDIDFRVKK